MYSKSQAQGHLVMRVQSQSGKKKKQVTKVSTMYKMSSVDKKCNLGTVYCCIDQDLMSHFNLVAIVNLLESKATYGSGLNDKLINDLANLMTLKFMSFIH